MALYGGSRKLGEISSTDRVERFFHCGRDGNCVGYRISYPTPAFCCQRRVPKRAMMLCIMIAFTMRATPSVPT
jgi:hypothetical protein